MGYQLQLDNNLDFASLERDVFTASDELLHMLGTPLPDGLYYWRVRATTDVAAGQWSETRSVAVITTPLAQPELTAPANNAVLTDNRPTFSWNAVPNAFGYRFQLDNGIEFDTPY